MAGRDVWLDGDRILEQRIRANACEAGLRGYRLCVATTEGTSANGAFAPSSPKETGDAERLVCIASLFSSHQKL